MGALSRRVVFIIFQENHSFDNYFGTYPGAENLGTAFAKVHGYSQTDLIGWRQQTVFKTKIPDVLGPQQYRYVLEKKFDGGRLDRFISAEEGNATGGYGYSAFVARQFGLTTMASYDCDRLPICGCTPRTLRFSTTIFKRKPESRRRARFRKNTVFE